jgi:hypothetical protein
MSNEKRRFHYHAHALALQGEVTHPFQEKIEPQAPSAVAPFGGFGLAQADPFSLRDVISHRGARSRAEAGHNPKTDEHYAVANVVLEGLNLSDLVTVDRIVARLTAVHSEKQEEPCISPHGSFIGNLRIAGHPIELIPLVGIYHTLDTMQKVREHYVSNPDFRDTLHQDAFIGKEATLPEKVRKFFPWRRHGSNGELPEFRGHTIVPLFRIVDPKVPGIEVHGSVIHIHHFGRLHIGELFISCDDRRVTMVHADLGSPQHADIMAASACGGTSPSDPP